MVNFYKFHRSKNDDKSHKISFIACAIDKQIYEESNVSFKLTCSTNGNYEEVQYHQNGKYYCVDALGYAVSDFEVDELTKEICNSRRYDRIGTDSYCA